MLDDSTCKVTRQLVDEKAAEWAERGIKCEVVRRTNRQGYKAGALKDVSDPSDHCHSLPVLLRIEARCFPVFLGDEKTSLAEFAPDGKGLHEVMTQPKPNVLVVYAGPGLAG